MKNKIFALINIAMSYLFLFYIMNMLQWQLTKINVLIILSLPIIITLFIYKLKHKKKYVAITTFLLLVAFVVFAVYFNKEYLHFKYVLYDFFTWSIRYIEGYTIIHQSYSYILLSLICMLITCISYLIFIKNNIIIIKILIGTGIFIISWFNYMDNALTYYTIFCFLVLIMMGNNSYEKYYKQWKTDGKDLICFSESKWVIYTLITSFLIAFFVFLIPKDVSPITWKWLDKNIQDKFPQLTYWRNEQKKSINYGSEIGFDLSSTGFQNDRIRLGGPVLPSSKLVLKVRGENKEYLRGRVSNIYTGFYWKSTKKLFQNQVGGCNLNLIKDNTVKGDINILEIEHVDMASSTLFSPLLCTKIKIKDNYYANTDFEMMSGRMILDKERYKAYYVKPSSKEYSQNFKKIKEEERKLYVQLPEILPQRVKDLTDKIVKDSSSDYEKLKEIEKYLRNNFEYSLDAEYNPYNRDFVDYFLFDLKKGYCTYFATAMTVMARCCNIPSRYVEGFRMSNDKVKGVYNVYNSNAHAWVEAYVEDRGWITFEPTPAFSIVSVETKQSKSEIREYDGTKLHNNKRRYINEEDLCLDIATLNNNEKVTYNEQDHKTYNNIKTIMLIIGILIIILLSILAIIIYRNIIIIRKKIYVIDNNDNRKAIFYIDMILEFMKKDGIERRPSETFLEYSKKNRNKLNFINLDFKILANIYNKAVYSQDNVRKEEAEYVKNYYNKYQEYIKEKIGRYKFQYYKLTIEKRILL
ncbi:transglutaminase-like domain-containing protein [Abyssisolibacter fermentans]|uniref:transglutaminase-like domain-containing protein n=1 Tax=Abyssisolibacter fermentans TaxID=1766203 RepID=UPI0008375AF7|nr:transglutaminase-like domain-containing protein [Abyssisolibacter fermentans]